MPVPTVTNSTFTDTTASATPNLPTQTLGQQDFLNLLIKQMTNQNPLEPMKDLDFIGQMAQFSSLEQAKSMQGDLSTLQANSLLGRTVEMQNALDPGITESGVAVGVQIKAGVPYVLLDNGQQYALSQVLSITPTPVSTQPTKQ